MPGRTAHPILVGSVEPTSDDGVLSIGRPGGIVRRSHLVVLVEVPVRAPLQHVAAHVEDTVGTGSAGEILDRRRSPVVVAGIQVVLAVDISIGIGPSMCTSGGLLPLRLRGQPLARPGCIGLGVVPAHEGDGMVLLFQGVGATRPVGRRRVPRRVHEELVLLVGHGIPVDPEGVEHHRPLGLLVVTPIVTAHEEWTGFHEGHSRLLNVRRRWLVSVRLPHLGIPHHLERRVGGG